jgi:hypothetical protein
MNSWSSAEPFVVLIYVVPVVAIIGTAGVAWTWAHSMSESWWVPPLAAALGVAGGYVGLSVAVGEHLIPLSPSQSFTTAWLLLFAMIFTTALRQRSSELSSYVLLALLGFFLAGGKVSHALVAAGGVAATTALNLVLQTGQRWRTVKLAAASASGVLAGFVVVIAGGDGNGFRLGPSAFWNSITLGSLPTEPLPLGLLSVALAAVAVLLSISARWVGLVGWIGPTRRIEPEAVFAAGALGTGLLALFLTSQGGVSQLYFAVSASAIVSVVSVVGLGHIISDSGLRLQRPLSWQRLGVLVVVPMAAAAAGFITNVFGRWVRSRAGVDVGLMLAGPVVVWAVCLVAAWRLVRRNWFTPQTKIATLGLAGMLLAVSSVPATELITWSELVRSSGASITVDTPLAMSRDHMEAASWLRQNSDTQDIVVTNRLCSSLDDEAPDCDSRWFLTSAVSHRRMLIEGYDYGVGLGILPDWAKERIEISKRFTQNPSDADRNELLDRGVRWVWIDRNEAAGRIWEDSEELAYRNDDVLIVRIGLPK